MACQYRYEATEYQLLFLFWPLAPALHNLQLPASFCLYNLVLQLGLSRHPLSTLSHYTANKVIIQNLGDTVCLAFFPEEFERGLKLSA